MVEKEFVEKLLNTAGIKIDGDRDFDIRVKDDRFYKRVLHNGSLGLGESYMDGWWECNSIDQFTEKIISTKITEKTKDFINVKLIISFLKSKIFNRQNKKKSLEVGEVHYDLGNDFYKKMLDKRMIYTSAYWKNSQDLDEAQKAKLDLVCRKAGLKPGMKILDIGCGWGGLIKYAVENYGVSAVGITISKEQLKYAQDNVKELDAEIRLQDYRDVDEKFDAIVSVEMFEAVGQKNFKEYMKVANKNLKRGGVFVLQTIGMAKTTSDPRDAWLDKYIFPNGTLPSQSEITKCVEGLFTIEDWHNFGTDYDKTLMEWYKNFKNNWSEFEKQYGEKFYRMWEYYLLLCAGSFRARHIHVWQIVLSKEGIKGGHKSIR